MIRTPGDTFKIDLSSPQRVHIVGILGAGMSAIARVLAEQGHSVSGSDMGDPASAPWMAGMGVPVHAPHSAANVPSADVVLVSAAIPPDNVEVLEAQRRGIPVIRREALLPAMLSGKRVVAVSGSHGKTTTTGMIAWSLAEAGADPSYIVGGTLVQSDRNAASGSGDVFVIEADEYQKAFLCIEPSIAVITNIEMDHPDCFPSIEALRAAFRQFVSRIRPGGVVIANGDSDAVRRTLSGRSLRPGVRVEYYGVGAGCEWRAQAVRPMTSGSYAFTLARRGTPQGSVELALPGAHSVLNSLASVAVLATLGIEPQVGAGLVSRFRGIRRRFEVMGVRSRVTVIDSYDHHPTQIAATLRTARETFGDSILWAVFQPHTYSRLKTLWTEFTRCFDDADEVLVLPVYAAREAPDPDVDPAELAQSIGDKASFVDGTDQAVAWLAARVRRGDVVLTLGAGDEWKVARGLLQALPNNGMHSESRVGPSGGLTARKAG